MGEEEGDGDGNEETVMRRRRDNDETTTRRDDDETMRRDDDETTMRRRRDDETTTRALRDADREERDMVADVVANDIIGALGMENEETVEEAIDEGAV